MPSAKPALLVASGAAVGAAVGAAAAWLGKRRSAPVRASASQRQLDDTDEPDGFESAELPIGHSADPEIDGSLSHGMLAIDATSGASLFGVPEPEPRLHHLEPALDEVWNALPGMSEGEQTEGYDAVTPEDLGAVWLERATQTTHEHRPHANDPNEIPNLEDLAISVQNDEENDEEDEDEIQDDDLDLPQSPGVRHSQR